MVAVTWESMRKMGRSEREIKSDSQFPGLSSQMLVMAFTEKGQAEEGTDRKSWE